MTLTFDPQEWQRVYDVPSAAGQAYVFRRSSDLARELAAPFLRPGQRWLDVGCGTGQVTEQLAGTVNVIGVDVDVEMLRFAKRRAGHSGRYLVAPAERLPFPDNSVDGIVAVSLVGCLASPPEFFTEAHRVLRPKGVAVMTFTNRASWLLRLNHLLPRRWISAEPPRAYRLFTAGEVTRDLISSGFVVRRVMLYNYVLHAGRWLIPPSRVAPQLDRWGIGWLARNFIVIAQKTA